MAPKRKQNENNDVNQTTTKRRFSKRLSNLATGDTSTLAASELSNKKDTKKMNTKSKSFSKKIHEASDSSETNDELVIDEMNSIDNTDSMSVGSANAAKPNEASSSSMDHSSASANNGTQLRSSTCHPVSINDDDEEDEFRRMFMSTTPKVTSHNYNSTPLNVSRKTDKGNRSIGNSSTIYCAPDTPHNQLSNTTNNPLNSSSTNSKIMNTTNNSCAYDAAPQSQGSPLNRSITAMFFGPKEIPLLETFPEYRKLFRDCERVKKENETWSKDYQALTNRMRRLEQTTFPRPTADGYAFIEQLMQSLNNSRRDEDTRTNTELARDFGMTEATLMSLSNTDPQKTALRLFNALFPSHQQKEALINVAHLKVLHPNLLDDILVFARRCSPGCGYNSSMLKEAIGNSIRCARHQMRRSNAHRIVAAAAVRRPSVHRATSLVRRIQ
ncbi:unnamed protein product [Adineta ricciae]|uniref:Uncharacterized protein n=1 Tax=Adineta ricciae TaxID=249248 RepID=A0A815AQK9_ADIRI|nr:unnamed protein product [Adineta ricciae]